MSALVARCSRRAIRGGCPGCLAQRWDRSGIIPCRQPSRGDGKGDDAPRRGGMRILVIEDDEETLTYIVRGLTQAGHRVDSAGNGRDGLYMAMDGAYDVVIIDRLLPVL